MRPPEQHLSDNELIGALDGELSRDDESRVLSHLTACWSCRARKEDLESAIRNFIRVHRDQLDSRVPPPEGPRALLKARLSQIQAAENEQKPWLEWFRRLPWRVPVLVSTSLIFVGSLFLVLANLGLWNSENNVAVIKPNPSLTPGATVLLSPRELCREANPKNKDVPVSIQHRIFDEYGIHTRRANSYEVDYLITPALGGADDIHNLWPQSRSTSPWNAAAKDALEDHLREMVCGGQVDLAVAQHDMAADWIEAYKKYFHTDHPAVSHR